MSIINGKIDRKTSQLIKRALRSQVEMGTADIVIDPVRIAAIRRELTANGKKKKAPRFRSLAQHESTICDCLKCPLGSTRTNFVYGVGNPGANLLFIGEAPGREEDLQGYPFVGRAGQLLDKILAAIQFSREDVYIANILKCRPPGNRDPQPDEMQMCMPYLLEQVRIIRPKIICALGRISAQALMQTTTPLGKLRRKWHNYHGIPFFVTYHPAALLRFPAYKRDVWEDMQMLRAKYDELARE
ncbi:MAG: uracil-DNA glycosylase [Candidatus Zixiibacteriota bacterium]|nr:MAG: uracil-DNA glycosylase [candidate division Zixibacteria bacterium]